MWLIMLQPLAADETRSQTTDIITGPTITLSNKDILIEAVQLDASIDVSVTGLLAQMTLTQSFRNTTDHWMQARYLFPLPDKAAVQGLTIHIGDRTIKGKIMPRQEARHTFDEARDTGRIAGLVEQQRPNLFTMNVATVAPQSELSVTLRAVLPVSVSRSSRWLSLPTTLTPRYVNSQTPQPDSVRSPFTNSTQLRGPRLTLNARIDGLADHNLLSSDTHNLMSTVDAVALKDIPMDRDVVIRWPTAYQEIASSEIHINEHDNERYAQILLNPPARLEQQNRMRRELTIVVDKSGSMAGESIRAARIALRFALKSLHPEDSFNIIAFDDKSYTLFDQPRKASVQNLKQARQFVRVLDADGGTEMRESLQLALQQHPDTEAQRLKQVVFLTDGSVGYEELLLQDIKQQLGDSRLFTIGIGSAPNQWFLEKAAQAGRGIAVNIPDSTAAADAIQTLLLRLVDPVVTDISVQFIGGRGELYPNPAPDLYVDKPQMLAARISGEVTQILVTGQHRSNGESVQWQQGLPVSPTPARTTDVPATKLFWTRLKVASLLDEQRYAIDSELHKDTITQLAVNAQLLSPYTSFVAVDDTPVRNINDTLLDTDVANLLPHGSEMQSIAMPRGAAGLDTLTGLSLLLAVAGLLMVAHSQRDTQPCA